MSHVWVAPSTTPGASRLPPPRGTEDDLAILLTTDGKGKEAKRAALGRLLAAEREPGALREAVRTVVAIMLDLDWPLCDDVRGRLYRQLDKALLASAPGAARPDTEE